MLISRPDQPADEITDYVMTTSALTDEIKALLQAASLGNAEAEAALRGATGVAVVSSQIIQRPEPALRSGINPDAMVTEITTIYRLTGLPA